MPPTTLKPPIQLLLGLVFILAGCAPEGPADSRRAGAAQEQNVFSNPIIPGFAPDPSIVRVGGDFYIVNSSFEYFPGLPIYHSRDLVNWELVGHALSNPEWADLDAVESSGGIHAATIRHHGGLFYVVTTNIVDGRPTSFVVTAKDPRGPWSEPVVVKDAVGIDPSLFFDDDGRVWYTANQTADEPEFPGQALIWLQEMDPDTLQLTGERRYLWSGCCRGAHAEGPHIYKRGGTYYLLLSEGGTSFEHAVSMASSKNVQGPYVGAPRNPLLTHRHLSFDHPITGVGHADLVELEDGRWYGVALGWRRQNGLHGILGRETFLFPVAWETERDWWKDPKRTFPVMSPESGKIDAAYPLPFETRAQTPVTGFRDDFDAPALNLEWNLRRSHAAPFATPSDGRLNLRLTPGRIKNKEPYGFVGVRQRGFSHLTRTRMTFTPNGGNEEAGLVLMQNDRAALTLTKTLRDGRPTVVLTRWHYGRPEELAGIAVEGAAHDLRILSRGGRAGFSVRGGDGVWRDVAADVDISFMSPAVLRGFNYTGLYVGFYASSNGADTDNSALFDYVDIAWNTDGAALTGLNDGGRIRTIREGN